MRMGAMAAFLLIRNDNKQFALCKRANQVGDAMPYASRRKEKKLLVVCRVLGMRVCLDNGVVKPRTRSSEMTLDCSAAENMRCS